MNKYEAWRGHPSDVSSVFGQEGVASQPRSDIVMGQEDGQHSRTYQDGRTIHSPLTCLAKAVGGIDIRQNTGRERPPHVPNHPPIQHFPYPPPNNLTLPLKLNTISHSNPSRPTSSHSLNLNPPTLIPPRHSSITHPTLKPHHRTPSHHRHCPQINTLNTNQPDR